MGKFLSGLGLRYPRQFNKPRVLGFTIQDILLTLKFEEVLYKKFFYTVP